MASNQRMARKGIGKVKFQLNKFATGRARCVVGATGHLGGIFSALEQYKAGEGNGDPNCPNNYVTKDTPPLKLGDWLRINEGKER